MENAETWIRKGMESYKNEKYEQALVCFEKAIEIEPSNKKAINQKIWTLNALGKYKEALEFSDKIRNRKIAKKIKLSEQRIKEIQEMQKISSKLKEYKNENREKLQFGIRKIDEILGGGIPIGGACLFEGNKEQRSFFAKRFFCNGLFFGEGCVYISTNEPISEIINKISLTGIQLSNFEKRFLFIEFGNNNEPILKETEATRYIPANDFDRLFEVIFSSLDSMTIKHIKKQRIVFDAVDTLKKEDLYKQVFSIRERIKNYNAVALFLIDNKDTSEISKELAEIIIKMTEGEILIAKAGELNRIKYEMTESGINIF